MISSCQYFFKRLKCLERATITLDHCSPKRGKIASQAAANAELAVFPYVIGGGCLHPYKFGCHLPLSC